MTIRHRGTSCSLSDSVASHVSPVTIRHRGNTFREPTGSGTSLITFMRRQSGGRLDAIIEFTGRVPIHSGMLTNDKGWPRDSAPPASNTECDERRRMFFRTSTARAVRLTFERLSRKPDV